MPTFTPLYDGFLTEDDTAPQSLPQSIHPVHSNPWQPWQGSQKVNASDLIHGSSLVNSDQYIASNLPPYNQ